MMLVMENTVHATHYVSLLLGASPCPVDLHRAYVLHLLRAYVGPPGAGLLLVLTMLYMATDHLAK